MGGLCDHIDLPEQRTDFAKVIETNRREVESTPSQCRILVGAEASMLTPNVCALNPALAARCDYVVVSCNHYHLPALQRPDPLTPESLADHHLDMIMGAIRLGFTTIIGHPFLNDYCPRGLALAAMKHYDEVRLQKLLRAASGAGIAFEINPYRLRAVAPWFRDFIQEARRFNVRFALGSDAHTLAGIGFPSDGTPLSPKYVFRRIDLKPYDLIWPCQDLEDPEPEPEEAAC